MADTLRAFAFRRAGDYSAIPYDLVVLDHGERHLRRRLLTAIHGDGVLVDLPEAVRLHGHDVLVLEDGRLLEVMAAEEKLLEVAGQDAEHLMRLAWHIGNRHLAAQIEPHRILIQRDHVIATMLRQLGAEVVEISEPFDPEGGAYAQGGGDVHHHHHQHDDHAHE